MPNKTTTAFSARKRLIVAAISACFVSAPAWSNPTVPQVVNGSASFNQAGKLLTVTNSNGAIINWNTFSIGASETTRFNQTSAASSVLNRVITNDPSVLLGALSSNGRVWLVNPAGIMVGQGARIDVAGFIASTLNVRNEDFLAGRLNFGATPNAGKIENRGQITTPSGGSVYLIAPAVENHGIINAPNGEVILAAGQTAQLIDTGTPGVKVDITGAEGNVTNLGEIVAEAGRIGLAGVLVKNSGALNASSISKEGGRIFLKATKAIELADTSLISADGTKGGQIVAKTEENGQLSGELIARGEISAQGSGAKGSGGFIETSAKTADINSVRVNTRGGTWLLDPDDVEINSTGTISAATLVTPTTIQNALVNNDFVVETSAAGTGGNGDIFVNGAVSWSSANSLTLNAVRNVNVNQAITNFSSVASESGGGNINISAGNAIIQNADIIANRNVTLTANANGGTGNFTQNGGLIGNLGTVNPGNITINAYDIQVGATASKRNVVLNAAHDIRIESVSSGFLGGGTAQNFHFDDASFAYTLPFGFTYYGVPYTTMFVSSNGIITFGGGTSQFFNSTAGLIAGVARLPTIAPAWSDWRTDSGPTKDIYIHQPSAGALAVRWDVVNFGNHNFTANFESVLSQSGNIAFNYGAATAINPNYTVTIGVSRGDGVHYTLSALNNPASLNNLSSTLFNYNATTGNYIETSVPGLAGGGSINALAGASLAAGGILNINNTISAATINGQSTGINLGATGALAASGAGDAIILNAGAGNFINNAGASSLSAPAGRWLVYSTDPASDVRGGLPYNFKQYGLAFDGTAYAGPGAGNGFIYSVAPIITAGLTGTTSKTYDGTTAASLAPANFATAGAIDGDTVLLNNPTSGFYADRNVGTNKSVTASGLSSIASATNGAATVYGYQIASTPASGSIGDITALGITGSITADNKVYDATRTATITGRSLAGVLGTDDVNYTGGAALFSDKNVANGKTVTGTSLGLSGADAGNYTVNTTATTTANITALGITGSITADNKVYDSTRTAAIAGHSLAGVLATDVVSYSGGVASFDTKNVGTGKTVTATGLSLVGGDAGNYTVNTTASTAADITPATLSVSGISANNKVYDGNAAASINIGSATLAGVFAGDNVSVTAGAASFADKNVGTTKPVAVSGIVTTGTDAGNYILSGVPTALSANITQRPLSTWVGSASGLWSNPANWDAIPDGANVAAVSIPAGGNYQVTYDASAGSTSLQNLNSAQVLALSGGNLTISGNLNTAGFVQSGGVLGGSGSLLVNNSFSQSGGSIGLSGSASAGITQTTGDLTIRSLAAQSVSLTTQSGSIQPAAGFSGANVVGDKAVIVAGGNATLSTAVRLLDVSGIAGTFSITDTLTGKVLTNVPAAVPLPTTAGPVLDQVISTITATTQQQPAQTTTQMAALPSATALGGPGALLLSNSTQTIGGAEGTFGGASSDGGDKPAVEKPAASRTGSDKKDDDTKKKDEETPAKKGEGKPAAKKLATCR